MKDGQEQSYFMTGESRHLIESSPHMEAFKAKGLEVLVLTDPVDEMWVDAVSDFDGKTFQSIAKGEVDLDTEDEKKAAEADRQEKEKEFGELITWLTDTLHDAHKATSPSPRLPPPPS